jgi:hypothetical protein
MVGGGVNRLGVEMLNANRMTTIHHGRFLTAAAITIVAMVALLYLSLK